MSWWANAHQPLFFIIGYNNMNKTIGDLIAEISNEIKLYELAPFPEGTPEDILFVDLKPPLKFPPEYHLVPPPSININRRVL